MSRRHRRDLQHDEYGQSWAIAAALWDGPSLLVSEEDAGMPLFDTTVIHAEAALNYALA